VPTVIGTLAEYIVGYELKTSVTLSEDIVRTVDLASRAGESRSQTIERLLRERLAAEARHAADQRELMLINRPADELNAEAADVLLAADRLQPCRSAGPGDPIAPEHPAMQVPVVMASTPQPSFVTGAEIGNSPERLKGCSS
jgi:hypothetical protein